MVVSSILGPTVDDGNPKQPPEIYGTLYKMGIQLPFPQLVNAGFLNHQQYGYPTKNSWLGIKPLRIGGLAAQLLEVATPEFKAESLWKKNPGC